MKVLFISCFSLMLSCLACTGQPGNTERYDAAVGDEYAMEEVDYDVEAPETAQPIVPAQVLPTPRKLLRTANMHFEVADLDTAAQRLKMLLAIIEGYVAREEAFGYYSTRGVKYQLRVPTDRFDEFLKGAEGLSSDVLSRVVEVVDVTEEYVDVAARLQTKQDLYTRLTQLLARADKVTEVIEVERELARVLADVEAGEARLRSLDSRADFARIDLRLSLPEEPNPGQTGFMAALGESITDGWWGARAFVLLVVTLWPFWLGLAAVGFAARSVVRRRRHPTA